MITAVSEATVPKVSRHRAQGLRRRALRHGRPGVRARGHHRPAHRQDRRDGPRGRGQRGVRQQDRRHRGPGRARGVRGRAAARSTRRTSTSCAWPPSWSSTPSSSRPTCAPRSSAASSGPRARTATSPTAATASPRSEQRVELVRSIRWSHVRPISGPGTSGHTGAVAVDERTCPGCRATARRTSSYVDRHGAGQEAKSGWLLRALAVRPVGSSQSSWRPRAVRSRK